MLFYYLNKINSDTGLTYLVIRTIIIYVYAIFLIRIGNKRFHFETPFDFILIIIIGAVLSRAINGPSTLVAAIVGSFFLILLHWLFALASFKNHSFGKIVKGKSDILIKNGVLNWSNLKKNQITEEDLREMCRQKLNHDHLEKIKEARLERTGRMSFITNKKPSPH